MRRLANWVLAIISALLAFANAPLWGKVDGGWSYSGPIFVFLSPILLVVITIIVGAFRAVSVATQRRELATQMASGLTRGRAVRGAARDGLRVGLLWGAAGIAVGALARQLVTGFSGTAFDANSAVELLSVFIVAVLSAVLSWTVVTALATRGTVGSAASASVDAPVPQARLSRTEKILVTLGGLLAAFGLFATQTSVAENADSIAIGIVVWEILAYVGLVVALPAFALWAAARLGVWLTRSLAPLILGRTATGTARGIAADALSRRSPLRGLAVAGMAAVLFVATSVTIISSGVSARNDLAQRLAPDAVISTAQVYFLDDTAQAAAFPEGWAPEAVPDAVVAELATDPRIIVVPAGILATALRETTWDSDDGDAAQSRDIYLAVNNKDMDAVEPDGLLPLYFGDAVKLTGAMGWDTGSDGYIYVGDSGAIIVSPSVAGPFVTLPRDWASAVFGGGPTSALLVYVTEAGRDGLPASADKNAIGPILDEHNLQGLLRTEGSAAGGDGTHAAYARNVLLVGGAFLLIAVALVIAMAAASVRLRAREYATLQALGATATIVRTAASIEAAVTAGVGVVLGLGFGVMAGLFLTPWMAEAPPETWRFNLGYDVANTQWWPLAILAVAGVALAAAGALAVRASLSDSPAEQLRRAAMEGIA